MFRSLPSPPTKPHGFSSSAAPEHPWINDGSTLNPSPGPLLKQRRDTAEGCRDRAAADLLAAVTMTTAHSRHVLEVSAAAWTVRAELLQRSESGTASDRATIQLTPGEIAEDAAFARL
jgi:hypothetical protein